jgi:hypothetical protein
METVLTNDERADLIAGLLERIEHLNGVIEQRRTTPQPNTLAVEEFTALRDKYLDELNKLFWNAGFVGELRTQPIEPRRAA